MNVALVTIATNKYTRYVGPLFESARRWFCPDEAVTSYVFTNRPADIAPDPRLRVLECPSWGFPDATLNRYRLITDHADAIKGDAVFWIDADMLFVGPVGREIVPEPAEALTAVRHPGFWQGGGSWEERSCSMALTPPSLRTVYYAGGFQGGLRDSFLLAASCLAGNIDRDASRGVVAVWHDESHWNAYLATMQPKILSPAYCYPDHLDLGHGIERRLLALFKDHAEVRS